MLAGVIANSSLADAEGFTSGAVMSKMDGKERFAFVAGIVEGLAMARYMRDAKRPDGMKCINDWFYQEPKNIDTVYAAFQRYPDYPPGTVVDLLVKRKCGE